MKTAVLGWVMLLGIAGLSISQSVEPANVGGKWEIRVVTSRGTRVSDVDIVQDGEALTVTMTNPQSGAASGKGTIKGVDISWSITRKSPLKSVTFSYAGKVEGETMSGEITTNDSVSGTWTAARKKPEPSIG